MTTIFVNTIKNNQGGDPVNINEVKTDKITGKTTAGSIPVQGEGSATTNLQQGLSKSWCRWESSGTASVEDSFNHSSMTDNGTGDQTITSAMANTTYAHVGMAGGGSTNLATIQQQQSSHAATTTAQRYETVYANGSVYDWPSINAALFGDLA